MQKIVIFGAGTLGKQLNNKLQQEYEIIGYIDNDTSIQKDLIDGIMIYPVSAISVLQYDYVVIATMSPEMFTAMNQQLLDIGIAEDKIITKYYIPEGNARKVFVEDFSKIVYEYSIQGAVAEVGVFRGDFAKIINRSFHDRKLYLFDTFTGFDKRDVVVEQEMQLSGSKENRFCCTSEEIVLSKMENPDLVLLKKGYFPNTALGIEESFCFVSLDVDLYLPTLKGLEWFSERMAGGGVIIVHDYFSNEYKGVRKAVQEFMNCHTLNDDYAYNISGIGDGFSIAISGF